MDDENLRDVNEETSMIKNEEIREIIMEEAGEDAGEDTGEYTIDNGVGLTLPPLRESGGAGGVINARGLAEGAMMTALVLILSVISTYVPILSLLAHFLVPVPLALIVLRHGMKLGCLCAASVLLLSSMMLGFPRALLLFVQFGLLGLYFGICFRQKIRAAYTLFGGVMLSSVAMMFGFIFPSLVAGISLEQYQVMMTTMISDYVDMLQQSPNSELVMRGMTPAAYLAFMEEFFRRMLPSLLIICAMSLTWLCYVLMCKLLRRFGYEVSSLPIFSEWRLDWRFLWALIAALALAGVGSRLGYEMMTRIGDNLLLVFSPILLVCGVSMIAWLLKSWKVATFIKVLVVFFAIQVFGTALELLMLVGVFDPLFDFRRRITRMREKRQAG